MPFRPAVNVTVGAGATPDQSIPNNAATAASFDTVNYDTAGMFDAGSPTRLTCVESGLYLVIADTFWNPNVAGYRQSIIRENGATSIGFANQNAIATAGVSTLGNAVTIWNAVVGDFLELMLTQTSGGALGVAAGLEAYRVTDAP